MKRKLKRFVVVVALALALFNPFARAGDRTVVFAGVALKLTDAPCSIEGAPPGVYFAATGAVDGKTEDLCWSLTAAPGALCIVDASGGHVDIPVSALKDESI